MPSDDQIRAEVHRLADGLEVDTDRHLAAVTGQAGASRADRRRRLVLPLAAAAAVAAVVVTGVVLTRVLPSDESVVEKPTPVLVDGTPDGTVPSVFGHTRDSAAAMLDDLGLTVAFGEKDSCGPEGRPVGTEPAIGTPVEPGETVTVLLSYVGPSTDCIGGDEESWRFVYFATGRGPAPGFADQVELFLDGEQTATLSGDEAARGDWGDGSALAILDLATREVLRKGDTYVVPDLRVLAGTPPDTSCGVARPGEVGDREALTLTIDFDVADEQERCPARVAIYETDGAIDAVVAWSESATGGAAQPIPDVVGLSLTDARDQVTAAGYTARVEELETCHPREGTVVEQAPSQQDIEDDAEDSPGWFGPVTLVVEVPHTRRDCAALDQAAAGFLAFAHGGPAPDWAPEVRQVFGYELWDTITAERADDRDAWSFCSGVAPEDCSLSALVLAGQDVEVETDEYPDLSRWPPDEGCNLLDRGGLPTGLSNDQQIVLYPAELDSCADEWQVWLWIDDAGRIEAVNLAVPSGE
jgi:hypothetical protein